jgi:superfamily I DNA and/or RNA helicase
MRGFEDKYDYVIIDEAARSNPLDLLIPMCMGKKVILVGDHKQLPHMVESDVVNAVIDKTKDESVKQVLEESLFMRLFHKVREADEEANKKNNIKISRTCTLNEQFRMHSAICDLINVFYKEEQLRPACEQGKERDFDLKKQHNLNLYNNKPLVWIDVPITEKTPAEKGGISKSRPCEVSVVKKELAKILSANTDYDIGIITFYSKQAQLIKEMIDDEFPSETHRISVGTVDAFQGKEFDVVILSSVRSNMETDSKKRVGFLNNNNRLCVAFSRAKRLLVTVGDSNTVAGNDDVTYVEPLKELFERSKQEDVGYYEII